ncbi:hypothetical protein HZS_3849 [Henneguya salminicola]|nr:hypothetical protein HZS_3849 [Henneguya salminicola]
MLAQLLIGSLLAVIAVERFHRVVALIPWLFDFLYFLLFPKLQEDKVLECQKEGTFTLETENYVLIPENVDLALTNLLKNIYSNYVESINNMLNLSIDTHKEFRGIVRHFFSDFYHRVSKINLETLILNTFIPKFTNHLIHCKNALELSHIGDKDIIQKAYPSNQIHSGILFEQILILLLRSVLTFNVFKPLIEYLSTPDNIKQIIIRIIDSDSVAISHFSSTRLVPILKNFINQPLTKYRNVATPPKIFMLSWNQVRLNESFLRIFMQVLKNNSRFIFAHFCVTLENWNEKVAKLETYGSKARGHHIESLISEAYKIYQVFVCFDSYHRLKFPPEITLKISQIDFNLISEENLSKIQCLLSLSYSLTYDVLTTQCLDYFYRSRKTVSQEHCLAEYLHESFIFIYLFYVMFWSSIKSEEQFICFSFNSIKAYKLVLKIYRKELGIRTSTLLDKNISDNTYMESVYINRPSSVASDEEILSDSISVESNCSEQPFNIDISKFQVKINDLKTSIKKNGKIFLFVITLTSSIPEEAICSSWEVTRQYKEFYGLENKLKRFHGARITHYLPAKKSLLMYKNYQFLKNCRKPFEQYLESLLQNPYLKHSSMLYAFLRQETNTNSTMFFTKTLTIDTGRAIQSVIGTLSTEKGKYIDAFIHSFASSTEYFRSKPSSKTSLSKLKKKFNFLKDQFMPNSCLSKLHWSKMENLQMDIVHEILKTC